jgi:hypothetical protein
MRQGLESTVTNIINGTHGWAEIKNSDAQFQKYRNQTRRELQVSMLELNKKCLQQIDAKLSKASAAQAAMIHGILTDKERLQAGESTQNIEIHTKHEDLALDRLAEVLSIRLVEVKE